MCLLPGLFFLILIFWAQKFVDESSQKIDDFYVKLLCSLFRQLLESFGLLFISTSGRTGRKWSLPATVIKPNPIVDNSKRSHNRQKRELPFALLCSRLIFGLFLVPTSKFELALKSFRSSCKWCLGYWPDKSWSLGWEPWSSGHGMRLMFRRLWVQFPALTTRWTFFLNYLL